MKKQKASLIGKERTLQLVLLSNFIAAHFLWNTETQPVCRI